MAKPSPQKRSCIFEEHFHLLLNDHTQTLEDLLRNTVVTCQMFPFQEYMKAIKQMKPGRAPSPDNISLELFKFMGNMNWELSCSGSFAGCHKSSPRISMCLSVITWNDWNDVCKTTFGKSLWTESFGTLAKLWQGSTTSDMVCTLVTSLTSLSCSMTVWYDASTCRMQSVDHFPSRPKQGHILTPTVFSIYLAVMLNEVPCNSPGVDIHYHLNGRLFKFVCQRAKTLKSSMKELQYADKYLYWQPPTLCDLSLKDIIVLGWKWMWTKWRNLHSLILDKKYQKLLLTKLNLALCLWEMELVSKRPEKAWTLPTSQAAADPLHQMAGLAHQQWSPQLLRNDKHWSCHTEAVRTCHQNSSFTQSADSKTNWKTCCQLTILAKSN